MRIARRPLVYRVDVADWRKSPRVAVVAVVFFVVIQLIVPIARTASGEKGRFGWQMFSLATEPIEFVVHTDDESTVVDLEEITARHRNELPFEDLVPPFLCQTTPGAVEVTWDDQTYRC